MPKQYRWTLKRDLDKAVNHLDKAEDLVLRVGKPFEHVHDDYFDRFIKVVASIHITIEVIKQLRDAI